MEINGNTGFRDNMRPVECDKHGGSHLGCESIQIIVEAQGARQIDAFKRLILAMENFCIF